MRETTVARRLTLIPGDGIGPEVPADLGGGAWATAFADALVGAIESP